MNDPDDRSDLDIEILPMSDHVRPRAGASKNGFSIQARCFEAI